MVHNGGGKPMELKTKLIGIFVIALLIAAAVLPVVSSLNVSKTKYNERKNKRKVVDRK